MGNLGRFAGLLYVLTSIVGFFAMGYVPGKLIVHGNTAATVNNIAAHEMLFRIGIAGQLVSQAAFIFVAFALYKLLAGVDPAARLAYGDLDLGLGPYRVCQRAELTGCPRPRPRRRLPLYSRKTPPGCLRYAVPQSAWPRIGYCRIVLGTLALSARAAGVQVSIPAAVSGGLARPCRGRLGRPEPGKRSAAAISERGLHVQSTRCLRRDCIHVVAVD